MTQGTFPEGLQGGISSHSIQLGVYLPSSLSALLSHWPSPTPWGANTTQFLVTSSSSSEVLHNALSHACRDGFLPTPKVKGQPGESGQQPGEEESSNRGKLRSHTRHGSQCNLIKPYLGEELRIHALPDGQESPRHL